jgi:hypothetical protein
MRSYCIDRSAAVKLPGNYRIIPGTVVHINHSGPYPVSDIGAAQHSPSLVIYLDDIAVSDTPGCCIRRMYPQRLIVIAIRLFYFAGRYFTCAGRPHEAKSLDK